MKRILSCLVLGAAVLTGPSIRAAETTSAPAPALLIVNGDFEADKDADGTPDGWPKAANGVSWEKDGANHFMRLKVVEAGKTVMMYRAIVLKPEIKALALSYKVRYDGIKVGKQAWFDGRIMMNFKDAEKKEVKPGPKAPYFRGTQKDWQVRTQTFNVPEGAATLELMFTLFNADAGTLDFDEIKLVPTEPDAKADADAAAAAALLAMVVPAPEAAKMPPELHVAGNRLQTAEGKEVWLQGVCVDSLEWSNTGENIVKSVGVAIDDWKANVIRLPVHEDRWFGKDPGQKDGGEKYRQIVDNAINSAASRGAYMVIDLHRFRAPEAAHVEFWKDVATKYKNNPAVLFELFNEPHDISWQVWKDGGDVTDKAAPKPDVTAENNEKLRTFQTVGMQKLVDTIRDAGAKNIIIAGGLDWSYDISGVLKGFALDDTKGNGVMYSTHVYPWKRGWQHKFLDVAEKYPLFVGEVGADIKKMGFIKEEYQEDPYTWSPDMIGLIQKHRLNWTAFSFHPRCTPRAILDWDYTPTPFWGEMVKKALSGTHYEMIKMR